MSSQDREQLNRMLEGLAERNASRAKHRAKILARSLQSHQPQGRVRKRSLSPEDYRGLYGGRSAEVLTRIRRAVRHG